MIAVGSDHAGYELKNDIIKFLAAENISHLDFGCFNEVSCDYPDVVLEPCKQVVLGRCSSAILFCGTGLGVAIAANKINGIRAVCCFDEFSTKMARTHNDANVLCLGGRIVGFELAKKLVKLFLSEKFEGGRHEKRIQKIRDIEGMKPFV